MRAYTEIPMGYGISALRGENCLFFDWVFADASLEINKQVSTLLFALTNNKIAAHSGDNKRQK